jgi:hypothetical protein
MNKDIIGKNIQSMFWEPAIDYANAIEPITFETDEELPPQQEKWDKVHKAYTQGVKDVIDYILANFKLEVILPIKEETEEEKRIRLRDSYEYHSTCARATIFPGKSIEEVSAILLDKRIEETYKFVNDLLLNTTPMNTKETRHYVVELIQKRIDFQVIVKCDEENNPPEVIDENILIAQLFWNTPYDAKGPQIHRSTLVFGEESQIDKYQKQYLLDNELYKFIEKGI